MLADITSFQQNEMSQAELARAESTTGVGGGRAGRAGREAAVLHIFSFTLGDWELSSHPMRAAETSQAGRDPPISEGLTGKKRGPEKCSKMLGQQWGRL